AESLVTRLESLLLRGPCLGRTVFSQHRLPPCLPLSLEPKNCTCAGYGSQGECGQGRIARTLRQPCGGCGLQAPAFGLTFQALTLRRLLCLNAHALCLSVPFLSLLV